MTRAFWMAAVISLLAVGCGGTGPGGSASYPLTPVGSVDLEQPVEDLDFMGDNGDIVAVCGSRICFVDAELAYLLADVHTGSEGLFQVESTADGGYAIAGGYGRLYKVSNQTYLLRDSVAFAAVEELTAHDYTGQMWVHASDGAVVTLDVETMLPVDSVYPGGFSVDCALYGADVAALYRGGSGGIQRLSLPGLSVSSETGLPAAPVDLGLLGGYLFAAMGEGGLRALSAYSLATQKDYGLSSCGAVDVITGASVLMAGTQYGIAAMDAESGSVLGQYSAGSQVETLAVSADGARCAAVFATQPSVVVVFGTQ